MTHLSRNLFFWPHEKFAFYMVFWARLQVSSAFLLKSAPCLLCLQEITLHAPLPPGVCGSVACHQQEMPHLQSWHWDPTDPRQLIAPVDSRSFGSFLLILLPLRGGKLCQTPPFSPSASVNEPAFWDSSDRRINKAHPRTTQYKMAVDALIGGWSEGWLNEFVGCKRWVQTCMARCAEALYLCQIVDTTSLPSSMWCISATSSI